MTPIKPTWEDVPQVPDGEPAGNVRFRAGSMQKMVDGLKEILSALEKFEPLMQELELTVSPYERDMNRIKVIIEHAEADIAKAHGEFDMVFITGASYGTLRYLKAGVLQRILSMEAKRNSILAQGGRIPQSVLQSFQDKIQQFESLSEIGVFNQLKPADLFFDLADCSDESTNHSEVRECTMTERRVKFVMFPSVDSIPIIDDELRRRCLTLLSVAEPVGEEQNQLDAVVREMGVVLESRIRQASGLENAKDKAGDALVSEVFKSGDPVLQLSEDPKVQNSALLLFKGYFGFVRNDPAHNIVPTYTREHVLQMLGLTDYLLSLLDGAKKLK